MGMADGDMVCHMTPRQVDKGDELPRVRPSFQALTLLSFWRSEGSAEPKGYPGPPEGGFGLAMQR